MGCGVNLYGTCDDLLGDVGVLAIIALHVHHYVIPTRIAPVHSARGRASQRLA